MRIAIAQIEAIKGNIEKNIENHLKWIKQAIQNNADMVVFPELSLTGYEPDLAESLATNQDDTRLDILQSLSDKNSITIGVGLPTRTEGNVFISMIIFQPHKARTTYSKQYLYPPEKSIFTAGKNPLVLNLETEVVSPAICYEATVEAHCEYASQNNATIYIASVLSSVNGIDAELKKLANIATKKNMVTFMANYVGKSGGYECAGKSSVWNEKGELIGQLGDKEEGLIIFDTKSKELITAINYERKLAQFERLLNIMDELRMKCPWDREQTLESLRHLTIEETYELGEAILNNDLPELKKELGDLLLHIVFYAKIADEKQAFDIGDVIESLCEKLIYRHPHIFGDTTATDATEVLQNWEALKLKEKGRKKKRVLEGVPQSLPSMVKAHRIQDKVRGVGFDWEEKEQVWDKVKEELSELETEMKAGNTVDMEKEFGDLFFSMVNAARLYGIDPEAALERTNLKFMKRFNYLEENTIVKGKSLHNMSLDEMNVIWEEAKKMDN